MKLSFDGFARRTARIAGKPAAFSLAGLAVLLWAATGPLFHFSDTWQLVINTSTTIITFLMVFLIQASQNRDGEAIQAKLDELLYAQSGARNQLIQLETKAESEIEQARRPSMQ